MKSREIVKYLIRRIHLLIKSSSYYKYKLKIITIIM